MKRIPEFIIFTGPMFGSKTTRLIAALDRFSRQGREVVAFKPRLDNRYADGEIVTHSGGKVSATIVQSGKEIVEIVSKMPKVEVVGIDEAFMIDGVSDAALALFRKGLTVVVSSLQISATGNVFEEVRDMMPWATKIEVCPAVCPVTGLDAFYTHRKFENMEEISVGGSDLYEPRCWFYHPFMNTEGRDVSN
jgi:thymidine kinase